MAQIDYSYEDKNNAANNHYGQITFTFVDFAHSLLCLNGKMSFFNSVRKWLSAVFAYFSDFTTNSHGELRKKQIDIDAYDGIKKSTADIYGAAITVHIARSMFGHKHVFSISDAMVTSTTGRRPDFIATDGTQYSLFESKASINTVRTRAINDGIDQLNSVASINLCGTIVNSFKEKVLVSTDLNHTGDHVCCGIIDPDEQGNVVIDFSLGDALKDYYFFVKRIIDSNERRIERNLFGLNITLSQFKIDGLNMEVGMIADLYERCEHNELSMETINNALDFDYPVRRNQSNGFLFKDGVYIKVKTKSDDYYNLI